MLDAWQGSWNTPGVSMTRAAVISGLVASCLCAPSAAISQDTAPQSGKSTFRSAVDVVSVAAVVRDKHGRFATRLTKDDFVVTEAGARRAIIQFRADDNAPGRVALLF